MAQQLICERLQPGELALDATAGNGHDTLFLAQIVGAEGRVIGLDVQAEAIAATRERTAEMPWVELHQTGHERVGEFIGAESEVKAAMFNLGYLPKADKSIITRPDTTLAALDALVERLAVGGIITIAVYTGHEGGPEEGAAVLEWAQGLDQTRYTAIEYRFLNQVNSPPSMIAIECKPTK